MQDYFNHKKLILDANADCDLKAGSALCREQMAPLQGDDQPPDSTFYECYIFASEQKQTPFFYFLKKKQLRQQFANLNQNRKLNVSHRSSIRWFLYHKQLLKVAAFSNYHCLGIKIDEMNASCIFVHYSILLPFDCIARVPSWFEYMRSVRSTAAAAVALRAIVSQIGGFMIKISSLLFWWALMSPVCFEQPRMKLADNEERLNGVGFLSNLWVNKYCFLPIISSCLLLSLFAFILSKSGMVHPLTPSDLLTREHSHKPIKQTQDTRTARTVRFHFGSWINDGFLSGFTSWKRPRSDRKTLRSWFKMTDDSLFSSATQGDAGLPGVAGVAGQTGEKGDKVWKRPPTLPEDPPRPLFISGCTRCSLDFHTWAASRSTPTVHR